MSWTPATAGEEQFGTEVMKLQKTETIRNNPVKRGYVNESKHWQYDSTRNYRGQAGLLEVATDRR